VWCNVQLPTLLVVSQVPWLQSKCGGLIDCGKMARGVGWLPDRKWYEGDCLT